MNTSIVTDEMVWAANGAVVNACYDYMDHSIYGATRETVVSACRNLRREVDKALAIVEPPAPATAVRYRVKTRDLIQALTPDEFARLRAAGVIVTSGSTPQDVTEGGK